VCWVDPVQLENVMSRTFVEFAREKVSLIAGVKQVSLTLILCPS